MRAVSSRGRRARAREKELSGTGASCAVALETLDWRAFPVIGGHSPAERYKRETVRDANERLRLRERCARLIAASSAARTYALRGFDLARRRGSLAKKRSEIRTQPTSIARDADD